VPSNRIPILILTDCEPDPRLVAKDSPDRWTGFERFFEFLTARRAAIGARTGVPARFAWFWRVDLQIEGVYGSAEWPLRTYAGQIADCEAHQDEHGLHTHAWRWDEASSEWVADHGTQPVVEACVRQSFAAYDRVFGRGCRIFRFGDGWINEPTLALLEELGVRIDLTVEPGHAGVPSLVASERSTGSIPDRRSAPRVPYRPARHDFTRRDPGDDTRLWCLPVTTGHYRIWPRENGGRRRPRAWLEATRRHALTLNLGFDPRRFLPIFDRAVAARRLPYAALAVRTDVGGNAGLLANVARNLDGILQHRLANRFAFVTPSEGLRMLRES
jgi:peptidoglycan/xylan/chitin deacetylase (PgdA/CDA1 family)